MTVRALVLGLLAAALLAGVGYLNDSVLRLTPIIGNHLPISVFGIMILCVIALNPLLHLLWRRMPFRAGELGVIVAVMLVACSVPTSGLMRTFVPTLALPAQYQEADPGWKNHQVLSYVPPSMLPARGGYDKEVLDPLFGGAGRTGKPIGLGDVPWGKWRDPLVTWMPMIFLMGLAGICVALIVHPQWSGRERLRYPVVQFARSLLEQEGEGRFPPIVRDRLFWIGLVAVATIHAINGLKAWDVIDLQIPLTMNLTAIRNTWPKLAAIPGQERLFEPSIYLTVVAFSFFLASDVAFSLGISHILHMVVIGSLLGKGIKLESDYLTGGPPSWQLLGSYLGIALLMAYTGRRYYWGVVKQGLTFRPQQGVQGYSAWAFRLLIAAVAGVVIILVFQVDLPWPLAILFVLLVLIMFTVMARINAESGLFWCQPYWHPITVFIGLFGAAALGPKAFVVVGLLCAVFTIDPRECLMPFVTNGLKLCEDVRVRPASTGRAAAVALLLALVVAVPVVLWANYNFGLPEDNWATKYVPKMPFDALVRQLDQFPDPGELRRSESLTTWERFAEMHVDRSFLLWAGAGVALALGVSMLRLRFTWWPLHPILFLVWGTFPIGFFFASFLIGWIIKVLVAKLGGGSTYSRAKRLMIGVIAGDLIGGLAFMVAGAVYYGVTGTVPPKYHVFVG